MSGLPRKPETRLPYRKFTPEVTRPTISASSNFSLLLVFDIASEAFRMEGWGTNGGPSRFC